MVAVVANRLVECDSTANTYDKDTVSLAIEKQKYIRKIIARKTSASDFDIDEMYQMLIEYLYTNEDAPFDSLESFVYGSVKIIIKRYFSDKSKNAYGELNEFQTDNTAQEEIDFVENKIIEDNIEQTLSKIEKRRYKYGFDSLLFLYAKANSKNDSHFLNIAKELEILESLEESFDIMNDMNLMNALKNVGKKQIGIVKEYIYCSEQVDKIIKSVEIA